MNEGKKAMNINTFNKKFNDKKCKRKVYFNGKKQPVN